mgnify:CR=1 FL=1|jgi:DNA-binding transcriptional MerR regulator
MEKDSLLSVGELAKKMGVTVRTLQYYDTIGLLQPASFSEGGRRMYGSQEMVLLHQIRALKHLGFSLDQIKEMRSNLDSPQELAQTLKKQRKIIVREIKKLQKALKDIDALHEEVLKMDKVDFSKYADIIMLLQSGNEYYWLWKEFNDEFSDNIRNRFSENPKLAQEIMESHALLLDKAILLKQKKISPKSEEALFFAEEMWTMLMKFTGGDMSLFSELLKFNENKETWDHELAQKQKEADEFISQALEQFFIKNGIAFS